MSLKQIADRLEEIRDTILSLGKFNYGSFEEFAIVEPSARSAEVMLTQLIREINIEIIKKKIIKEWKK